MNATEEFPYRCPVTGRETRSVAASPEQTRVRVVGPCAYETIQAATDAAQVGDTIYITAGDYGQTPENGQPSERCYAVVICPACTKVHVVDRIKGEATTIDGHSQVQVAGHGK